MNYSTLSLQQLGHVRTAHQERRPSNHAMAALRIWATTKEQIEFWISIRTQDEASRWKPVFIPEKAVNVPQPPPENMEQGLKDRVAELRSLTHYGLSIVGPEAKRIAARCAWIRLAIRTFCNQHGLEIPECARVIHQKDRVA